MKKQLKKLVYNLLLVFMNYFVAYIPCWHIRKWFYQMLGMKIGKHSRINQRVFIYNPWNIEIGSNTMINAFSIIDGRGGLKIGSNVSVSMRSIIYTASHKTYSDSFEYFEKESVIENCCWIGAGAVLLPGTHLKSGSVIGANAVFKGIAKEKGIYTGNPAVFLREREISGEYELHHREFFT